jgi:glucose-6-phosphate 1-epimerase
MQNDLGRYAIKVNHFGGQVVSVIFNDIELLYLSTLSLEFKPVRGGVPVLFPQFANNGALSKHGFARNLPWIKSNEEVSSCAHRIQYSLVIEPDFNLNWPHKALLEIDLCVSPDGFKQKLTVMNAGSTSFDWTGGLHPYFAVSDLCKIEVHGLSDVKYFDCHNPIHTNPQMGKLHFDDEPCEKLFDAAPNLIIQDKQHRLAISTTEFKQWMIWNPGQSNDLADLPEDAWRSFLCVEPVIVSNPNRLNPGEVFVGEMIVGVEFSE